MDKTSIMNFSRFILLLSALCFCLSSCSEHATDKDKAKLIEEAKSGNIRAIEHVYRYCDISDSVKKEYEQILLEKGNAYIYNKKYIDEARKYNDQYSQDKIRRKWALLGAEHGNIDDIYWLYRHSDKQEEKLNYEQILVERGYDISPEESDDNVHLFDFIPSLVKQMRSFSADGTCFAQINLILSHIMSHTAIYSIAMFFQTNWWEGLIGIVIVIAFLVFVFKAIFSDKGFVFKWNGSYKQWTFPFLWNMLYATLNGGIIIICMIQSLTGMNICTDIPDGVLNIGSFSRIPGTSSPNVDAAIIFSWVWLVGMIGYLLYFSYNTYDKDKKELLSNIGILLAAIVSGYIIGICLSLLTIIAIAYLVYLFTASLDHNSIGSSSSSSSSITRRQREEQSIEGTVSYDGKFITDGNGRTTRITDVDPNGIIKDEHGNHWEEGVGGKLHKTN